MKLEELRLTDEEIAQAHEGEKCRDCGRTIAEAQLQKIVSHPDIVVIEVFDELADRRFEVLSAETESDDDIETDGIPYIVTPLSEL